MAWLPARGSNHMNENEDGIRDGGSAIIDDVCEEKDDGSELISLFIDSDYIFYEGRWPSDLFDVSIVNIRAPALHLECLRAIWNRMDVDGDGRVKFIFLISLMGREYDIQKLHSLVTSAVKRIYLIVDLRRTGFSIFGAATLLLDRAI